MAVRQVVTAVAQFLPLRRTSFIAEALPATLGHHSSPSLPSFRPTCYQPLWIYAPACFWTVADQAPCTHWPHTHMFKGFATTSPDTTNVGTAAGSDCPAAEAEGASSTAEQDMKHTQTASTDQLLEELKSKEEAMQKLTEQVEQLTDAVKRTLAEMENLRQRTAREMESAKKFAVQGFAKALLDVPDNLERAVAAIPPEGLDTDDAVKLRSLLKGLLEGVRATDKVLLQVLRQHGVQQYDPINTQFDPNQHMALFEVQDPSKDPGLIAVVTKKGYLLHERVLRPAEVGVVRA